MLVVEVAWKLQFYQRIWRVGYCQTRVSGGNKCGSGGGSVRYRGGVNCFLIGNILHIYWRNGLVCCFPPDGGVRASGKIVAGATGEAPKNGGVWSGFIAEVDELVCSTVVHIVGYFSVHVFVSVNIFAFSEASTLNIFLSETKENNVTQWWGEFLMNLLYISTIFLCFNPINHSSSDHYSYLDLHESLFKQEYKPLQHYYLKKT